MKIHKAAPPSRNRDNPQVWKKPSRCRWLDNDWAWRGLGWVAGGEGI